MRPEDSCATLVVAAGSGELQELNFASWNTALKLNADQDQYADKCPYEIRQLPRCQGQDNFRLPSAPPARNDQQRSQLKHYRVGTMLYIINSAEGLAL